MGYLRRNFLPLLVGLSATLVGIAAVVVIVDTVADDDDAPARVSRSGAPDFDLDRFDGNLREFVGRALRERLGVDPTNVVYRREAGATPPMPPCGRRAL